jgi:hypothetical protein
MQQDICGICVVKDAPHTLQYKTINLLQNLYSSNVIYSLYHYETPAYLFVGFMHFSRSLLRLLRPKLV